MGEGFSFAPTIRNTEVDAQREWLKRNKVFIKEFSTNAKPYLYHVTAEMQRQGVPLEMALIPVIESSYIATARGGGGAGGLWQLMPGTGRTLGVRMNRQFDGRRDVVASTDAAIRYLKQLNREFDGDWLLTVAAYNQGELTVERAVAKARAQKKSADFWSLKVPNVTRVFVPRLIALAQMIRDEKHFGLPLQPIPDEPYFRQVVVQGPVDLHQVASLSATPIAVLSKLNSGYLGRTTEAGRHTLSIPYQVNDQFVTQLRPAPITVASSSSAKPTTSKPRVNDDSGKAKTLYRVKKGDNLGTISKRFKVEDVQIARWNGIKTNSVLKVGQQLVIWNDG